MANVLTSRDYNDLINTLIAEAGADGPAGMGAVAHVIWNRAMRRGLSPGDVVRAPNQFTGYYAPGPDAVKAQGNQAIRAQAAQALMDAFSGQSPDPTGGADHFYATGTPTPDWANVYPKTTTVGGHSFFNSGQQARAPAAEAMLPQNISFAHPDQKGILPKLATMFERAGNSIGKPVDLTSGHRTREYNKSIGGAEDSRHIHRDAGDVNMKGWTDAERERFAASSLREGATALITYDNKPDMMHVDMRPRPEGAGPMYMHNKSQTNIGQAPEWLRRLQSNNGIIPPIPEERPVTPAGSGFSTLAAAGNTPGTFGAGNTLQSDFATMAQAGNTPGFVPVQESQPILVDNSAPAIPFGNTNVAPVQSDFITMAQAGNTPGTAAATPASGLGGLLSGIMSALSGGAQASAQANQKAQDDFQENYAKTLGPNPTQIAQQLMDPVPTLQAEAPVPVPFRKQKPMPTSQEILASIFGRSPSNVMG